MPIRAIFCAIAFCRSWSNVSPPTVKLWRVVRSILRDQNTVLTVGSQMPEVLGLGDVTMSFPTIVNAEGIGGVVPLKLDPAEGEALTKSAEVTRRQIAVIEEAAIVS